MQYAQSCSSVEIELRVHLDFERRSTTTILEVKLGFVIPNMGGSVGDFVVGGVYLPAQCLSYARVQALK